MKHVIVFGFASLLGVISLGAAAQTDATRAVPDSSGAKPSVLVPESDSAVLSSIPVSPTVEPEGELPPEPARRRSALVEEVVVTAQKREENVQDVPISISAFSADQLIALGVTNPSDLSALVPGLQATESVGFAVTFLRGVGTDAFLMADPSVALYIDDVYLPFAMAANQKFGKLQRTEVLKGPQGTLFGRNATGGAINVVTEKPQFDRFFGSTELEIGNYGKRSGKAFVNIPVFDNFAFNFTALKDVRDSYYNGVESLSLSNPGGDSVGGEDGLGFQAKLRYQPVDWLDLSLNGTYVKERGVSGLYSPNDDPSPLGLALGIRAQKGFDNTVTSDPAYLDVDNKILSGAAKFLFDGFDAKVLASRQAIDSANSIDFDGSPIPIAGFNLLRNFARITTAEVQFLSNDTSWGSDKWSWIVGAYYFDSTQGVNPSDLFVATTNVANGTVLGVDITPESLPIFQQFIDALGNLPVPIPGGAVIFDGVVATESLSGFLQTTYHFTDTLAATFGGRYQRETRSIVDSRSYLETVDGERGTLLFDSTDKSRFPDLTFKEFSPKVSLEYRPFDGTLTYASYQQAQKSGTYNVINVIDTADLVKPEDIEAYEVGVKSKWLNGLLTTNAAAFYYKQKDLQVQFVSLLAGGAIRFQNAERATVKGIEFDVVADLVPSVFDGLYLTASASFLDSVFDKYTNAAGFDDVTGLYGENNDYSGNRVGRSPKRTGRVGLNKIFELDAGRVEIAGDYNYNSGFFTSASNNSASLQPAYDVYNARASYQYDPYDLTFALYLRNVLDEEYSVSKLNTDFGTLTGLAPPRTYGMTVVWKF